MRNDVAVFYPIQMFFKENMKTKIGFYRKRINITQEELAQLTGVTRQTIIALEKGKYNPSLELAYRITKALNQKNIENVFKLK